MKNLFIAVTAQLESVTALKWIDMDKGQLNSKERPPISFPCALVKVSIPNIEEASRDLNNEYAAVTVRLAFDNAAARTASGTPAQARAVSLGYLDIAKEVFEAFREFEPDEWSAFTAREIVQEERQDAIVVVRMSWRANRFE